MASLESENQNLLEKVQSALQERAEEAGALRDEIFKRDQHTDSLDKQISELRKILNEKEQFHISFMEREKQLEEQKSEIMASLTAAKCKLTENRKQFDQMLEGKQLELSKHLKELSQRHDQAIYEIQRKYEKEKVEIVSNEKEKADNLIKEMERKCADKILKQKEEAEQYLMHVKEEHGAMEYSASSIKKNNPNSGKEHRLALTSPETRRKVTRHEYEVETSNGKTITKRRKTKSTVMFGEPNLQKAVRTRTPNASRDVSQVTKVPGGGAGSRPGPIGDMFSEGSLNPYADDPYAFD